MRFFATAGLFLVALSAACVGAPGMQTEERYPSRDGTGAGLKELESSSYAGMLLSSLFDVRSLRSPPRADFRATQVELQSYEDGMAAVEERARRLGYLLPPNKTNGVNERPFDRFAEAFDETRNLTLEFTDYDNALGDPTRMSLADQLKMLPPSASEHADFTTVEQKLTALLDMLRTRLVAQMDLSAGIRGGLAPLQPLRVRIAGTGLNPTVAHGASEIVLSPDLLRDLFSRSIYRASVMFESDLSPTAFANCRGCKVLDKSIPAFAYSMYQLPAVHGPAFPSSVLSQGLSQIPDASLTPEEKEKKELYLAAFTCVPEPKGMTELFPMVKVGDSCATYRNASSDVRSLDLSEPDDEYEGKGWSRALDDVASLLRKGPSDTERDGAFERYRADLRQFYAEMNVDVAYPELGPDDRINIYTLYHLEFTWYAQVVNLEMEKAVLFLLSHEAYHAWFDSTPLRQTEFDADLFAVEAYNLAYPELPPDTFSPRAEDDKFEDTGDWDTDLPSYDPRLPSLSNLLFGKGPDFIFAETYGSTPYFEGTADHPSFAERLAAVRSQIDAQTGQLSVSARRHYRCMFNAVSESVAESCPGFEASPPPP